jgi:hypothetical protein
MKIIIFKINILIIQSLLKKQMTNKFGVIIKIIKKILLKVWKI